MLRSLVFSLSLLSSILFCSSAFADSELPPVVDPTVDRWLAYLSLAMLALSFLGQIMPSEWKLTQAVRAASSNVKGLVSVLRKGGPTLLVLFLAPACSLFRSEFPELVECAPEREYLIDNLESILSGEDPKLALDRVKREKGSAFVQCALRRYIALTLDKAESAAHEAAERYLLTEE